MKKMTVYLSSEQKQALKRAAIDQGRSESALIREAIDYVTARHRVREPTLPLFTSGIDDLASRAESLLNGFGEH